MCTLRNPIGLGGLRKILSIPNGHFEPRKGTPEQALAYCHKDETRAEGAMPFEYGSLPEGPGRGSRTDVSSAKSVIDRGGTLADVADADFGVFLRYHQGLRLYSSLKAGHRTTPPEAYYLFGPSGTGKSRAAWALGTPETVYTVPLSSGSSIWFDGYDATQHRVVIFDDYYHHFKATFLLQLLDRYPIQVPIKGGHVNFNSNVIVITSNIPLDQQYPNYPDQKALWRRFRRVVHCLDDQCWIPVSQPHNRI